jgi:hypothetical protein
VILKGIRDTTIEEDLEKEMEVGSENQNMINRWFTTTTHGEGASLPESLPRGVRTKGRVHPNPGLKGQ